jgi:hypothetical protein
MDHIIVHKEMVVKNIFYEFWIQKSIAFIYKKNDFVHHDIQVKIFKPSSILIFLRSTKQHGHCNGNHKEKLAYVTPKLVHPFKCMHQLGNFVYLTTKMFQNHYNILVFLASMPWSRIVFYKHNASIILTITKLHIL